jgi:hypothetical protein
MEQTSWSFANEDNAEVARRQAGRRQMEKLGFQGRESVSSSEVQTKSEGVVEIVEADKIPTSPMPE